MTNAPENLLKTKDLRFPKNDGSLDPIEKNDVTSRRTRIANQVRTYRDMLQRVAQPRHEGIFPSGEDWRTATSPGPGGLELCCKTEQSGLVAKAADKVEPDWQSLCIPVERH